MVSDEMIEIAALVLFNRMRARRGMKPINHIGANKTTECNECREEARAALEAVVPLIRADFLYWLDDLLSERLVAMHDHIHTIMDERAGNKISDGRHRKAAIIRAAKEALIERELARSV